MPFPPTAPASPLAAAYGTAVMTDGGDPSGKTVVAKLVGYNGYQGPFLLDSSIAIPVEKTFTLDATGQWSFTTLPGNDHISPSGSSWRFTQEEANFSKSVPIAAGTSTNIVLAAGDDPYPGGEFSPPAIFVVTTGTYADPAWITSLSAGKITGTLAIGHGGTGLAALGSALQILRVNAAGTGLEYVAPTTGSGTVTSVSWTGGIVSVATGTTTPAFTVAGTSGGIPYFSSASAWASSAALAANALVIGGGAGAAPATTTTATGVLTALGSTLNAAGGLVTFSGNIGAASGTSLNLGIGLGALYLYNDGSLVDGLIQTAAGPMFFADAGSSYLRFGKRTFGGTNTDWMTLTAGAATMANGGFVAAGTPTPRAAAASVGVDVLGGAEFLSFGGASNVGSFSLGTAWSDGSNKNIFFTFNDAQDGSGSRFQGTQGLSVWSVQDRDIIAIVPNPSLSGTPYTLTVANTKLTANRAFTVPDADTKVPIIAQLLTIAGLTSARTATFPDSNFTAARTDAANTFIGTQTIGALVATTVNGNTITTGTGTLTLAASKTLAASNTLTFAGTDGSTLNIGTGGTLGTSAYITLGTGVGTALAVNVGSAGAFVTFNGALGTPSGGTATNLTGLPVSTGISGLGTGSATALAAGTSEGGGGTADSGKLVKFGSQGNVSLTDILFIFGKSVSSARLGLGNANNVYSTVITPTTLTNDRNLVIPDVDGTFITTGNLTSITTVGTVTTGVWNAGAVTSSGAGSFTTLTATAATSLLLGTAGSAVGSVGFRNATSGTITVAPPTGALGTVTLTLPAATDTLVGKATTDTLTNKSIDASQLTGSIVDARNTVSNTTTTSLANLATVGTITTGTWNGTTAITSTQAISATSTDGLLLTNTTAATVGAQKWSPRLRFTGQGWKTTATAGSQTVDYITELQPVQGTTNPTANLVTSYQVNGGGYTAISNMTSAGMITLGGGADGGGIQQASSNQIKFRGGGNGDTLFTGACTFISGVITQVTNTQSTSTGTGSINTAGGLGVVKDTFLGGLLNVAGATTLTGGLKGTTTNDNATALNVGESISSLIPIGSATSLTTATAKNVTSISLTAGDWDVEGIVSYTETVATASARSAGSSSTSATVPTDGSEAYCGVQSTLVTEINSIPLPNKRFSLSGTTTVYLVASATFSAGTVSAFGAIGARRVR